jgi:hypothetical protein
MWKCTMQLQLRRFSELLYGDSMEVCMRCKVEVAVI